MPAPRFSRHVLVFIVNFLLAISFYLAITELGLPVEQLKITPLNVSHSNTTTQQKETLFNWTIISYNSSDQPERTLPTELFRLAPEIFEFVPTRFSQSFRNRCWVSANNNHTYCFPYFYLFGFPKCGTTDLYKKISQHPSIVRTPSKESWYWRDRDAPNITTFKSFLSRGDEYVEQIKHISHGARNDNAKSYIYGDGSSSMVYGSQKLAKLYYNQSKDGPVYTHADVIHEIHPSAKFIGIIRDPVERLYSGYRYFQFGGKNSSAEDFHIRVMEMISAFKNCVEEKSLKWCIYTSETRFRGDRSLYLGLYMEYFMDWLRIFPVDQFFILRVEDWNINCQTILPQIFQFLKIDSLSNENIQNICSRKPANRGEDIGPMLFKTRKLVKKFYQPYNENVAKYFNLTLYD